MTYSIVYSSKTGNTKMLADALHQALPADDCLYFGAPDAQALAAERIYIGFWTDKGTCDAETAAFLAQLTRQEIFLFGTCGFGGGGCEWLIWIILLCCCCGGGNNGGGFCC